MSRKNDWGSGIPRIPENSRLMRTHEAMVDLISGRATGLTFLDGLKFGLFGLDFAIEDEDDEYFDEDYDEKRVDKKTYCGFSDNFLGHGASKHIAPHPRIKQLTPEEAERHAQELLKEEEKFKEKTEKKRLKKLRQRERKRLQKDNEIKNKDVPDGEPGKSTSSDVNVKIQSKGDITESLIPETGTMENKTEVDAAPEESSGFKKDFQEEEERLARKPVDLEWDMSTCFVSTAARIAKRQLEQKAKAEKKDKKINIIQQPLEEKGKVLEQQQELNNAEEKKTEASVEDIVKRSTELALIGNQFAACGQLDLAVKYFTDAIKHNPKEYRLFGNRSLCYEKMQLYENALIDADLALSMQPGWIKGLFRKGKALSGLKRYYEAAVVYKEVLKLDSLCTDASQELMRVQTFQLMEMGFTWEQSSNALMAHGSFEKAVDVLSGIEVGTASNNLAVANTPQPIQEWVVLQKTTAKPGPKTSSTAPTQTRPKPKSTTPVLSDRVKPELFPVWVGSLEATVTEAMIHSLFSRAGVIQSVRMLPECHCAFVNYIREEDCESAVQMMHGMVVEGSTILVRYADRVNQKPKPKPNISVVPPTNSRNMECFFWRTTGCIKKERCTYRHVPAHKNIDREPSKLKTTPK